MAPRPVSLVAPAAPLRGCSTVWPRRARAAPPEPARGALPAPRTPCATSRCPPDGGAAAPAARARACKPYLWRVRPFTWQLRQGRRRRGAARGTACAGCGGPCPPASPLAGGPAAAAAAAAAVAPSSSHYLPAGVARWQADRRGAKERGRNGGFTATWDGPDAGTGGQPGCPRPGPRLRNGLKEIGGRGFCRGAGAAARARPAHCLRGAADGAARARRERGRAAFGAGARAPRNCLQQAGVGTGGDRIRRHTRVLTDTRRQGGRRGGGRARVRARAAPQLPRGVPQPGAQCWGANNEGWAGGTEVLVRGVQGTREAA
jgi:hypothetical protein